MEQLFDALVAQQQKRMHRCAQEILPGVTEDDLMQPNDFPVLENHPLFRYEEGMLEGLLTARMAYLARKNDLAFAK
jgi:hypothetical protein